MTATDDFVFDNQMLAQAAYRGARIGEISCPAQYFPEASSIDFRRSLRYGLGVLRTSAEYRLAKWDWLHSDRFDFAGRPAARLEELPTMVPSER